MNSATRILGDRSGLWLALILLLGLGPVFGTTDAVEPLPDPVDAYPFAVPKRGFRISAAQKDLLVRAAGQPDLETRLLALAALEQYAIAEGEPRVITALDDPSPHIRAAAADAAFALDLRELAPRLRAWLDDSSGSSDTVTMLVQRADRCLAAWHDQSAVDAWRSRLRDPEAALALRLSAAESLARLEAIPDAAAEAAFVTAIDREATAPLRIAAARVLGRHRETGLVDDALALATGGAIDQIVAAHMLAAHRDVDAVELRQQLARTAAAPARIVALQQLLDRPDDGVGDVSQRLPVDLLRDLTDHADPVVRRLAAEGLGRHAVEPAVAALFGLLNDPHPEVRDEARGQLASRGQDRNRVTTVVEPLQAGLAAPPGWRAAEQLARLAGEIRHQPAAPLLTGLLDAERVEVELAAVVALRQLDAREHLAELRERLERALRGGGAAGPADRTPELARQIVATFGAWRVVEVSDRLREMVPESSPAAAQVRAAAIWALGRIHEDAAPEGLPRALIGRMRDVGMPTPESDTVRLQSAIALGRMNAGGAVNTLRQYMTDSAESLTLRAACRWAIGRITGEDPEPLQIRPDRPYDLFLIPIE